MRFYFAERIQNTGLSNRRCIEHMQQALPGFTMRPKAAIVGVTYAGTGFLREIFDASPHIVALPVIQKAELFKVANEPSYGLLYFPYLVWLYRQGLWWPEDRYLRDMLLSAADNIARGMTPSWRELDSSVARPVLYDSYGFSGNENTVTAFHSPWYYDSTVKLIVVMRNPTDALYAAYRNSYLANHFGRTFEEEMKLSRVSAILSMKERIPFWEVFGMLPWQYGRCFFKNMLAMWMEKFPPENIYIVPNTELDNNKAVVLRGLADMLEIPELAPISDVKQMARAIPPLIDFPPMKEETREMLDAFFALYNDGIEELAARCNVLGDLSVLLKRIPLRYGRMRPASTVPDFSEDAYLASLDSSATEKNVAGMIRFSEALFVCGSDVARRKAARTLFALALSASLPGYACQALELMRESGEEKNILYHCAALLGTGGGGAIAYQDQSKFTVGQTIEVCLDVTCKGKKDLYGKSDQIFSQVVNVDGALQLEDYSAIPELQRQVLANRPAALLSDVHKERIKNVICASSGPQEYLTRFVPLGPLGSFCETIPLEA